MKNNNDFQDLDKAFSKEILKEFEGQIVDETCIECKGNGGWDVVNEVGDPSFERCENCQGKGFVQIEY